MTLCPNCKKNPELKEEDFENRWITDEFGTFFDEVCSNCRDYI